MTTGVPIYLVSACASAEEFVAAFRRYSDRGTLFIPIAEPLPPGRRGRIALTLTNGGVMLDGEVDIVSSSKSASLLHGRTGMTIRFLDPEEPTKTLLTELDRARLSMRPSPPSVSPRPAEVPASPRPVPPSPVGRIDAANALAECVSIGDVATLRESGVPQKPGQKFVMPSIPGAGTKVPTIPPKLASAEPIPVVVAPVAPSKPFRLPTPPPAAPPPEEPEPNDEPAQIVDKAPRRAVMATTATAVVPPPKGIAPPPERPVISSRMTSIGIAAITRTPHMPLPVAPRPPTQDVVTEETTGLAEPPTPEPTPEPDSDWTMSPSDLLPTPLEPPQRPSVPAGPMTGNWTIALTPDGWGEPEKIAASLPVPGPPTSVSGETGPVVAGEKPLVVKDRPEPVVDSDEGKIQIDPTLMEPLTEMPSDPTPTPMRPTPLSLPPPPLAPAMMMAQSSSQSQPYPVQPLQYPQAMPQGRGTGRHEQQPRMFEEPRGGARRVNDETSLLVVKSRKRRMIIIGAAVAIALIAIIAVIASSGGGKKQDVAVADPPKVPAVITPPVATPDAAVDAAIEAPPPPAPADAAVAPSNDCTVELQSTVKDIEVAIDNTTIIGNAPGTVTLPCGASVKVFFRKPGYAGQIRTIKPVANGKPIKIALARQVATFVVRVSSVPSGATILINGKPAGITPTTVKTSEGQQIQIGKAGFATQLLNASAKQNAIQVRLVAKPRSR